MGKVLLIPPCPTLLSTRASLSTTVTLLVLLLQPARHRLSLATGLELPLVRGNLRLEATDPTVIEELELGLRPVFPHARVL